MPRAFDLLVYNVIIGSNNMRLILKGYLIEYVPFIKIDTFIFTFHSSTCVEDRIQLSTKNFIKLRFVCSTSDIICFQSKTRSLHPGVELSKLLHDIIELKETETQTQLR